ncbi:MAG: hypothetical protein L3J56_09165 [Bacteroidales bacterium]|nr:hypothetical protein [Bacteroidales bacterium]
MSTNEILKKFKEDAMNNIPGIIAFSIVDIKDGLSLISDTKNPKFNPETAAVYNLEVVKAKMKAIKALNLKENISEIMITLDNQIHILTVTDDNSFVIYVAIDSKDTSLGLVRSLLKEYSKEIVETM